MLLDKRIPFPYIFKKIQYDLFVVICFTIIIITLKRIFSIEMDLPVAIPAFLGTAISLVLAFKLSQSYDRWWEARKIWGAIVNDSRSLVVQAKAFAGAEKNTVHQIAMYQISFCYALAHSLRGLRIPSHLKNLMEPEKVDAAEKSSNAPLYIINENAARVAQLKKNGVISEFEHIQMDDTHVRLVESMGKAERIKNTIFPKTYRIFLRFFIYVFLLTLAISLSNLHPYFEMGLLIAISIPFFLLKKTAQHMQDPFNNMPTDTSMLAISQTIETNLKELVDEKSPNAPLVKNKFFQM